MDHSPDAPDTEQPPSKPSKKFYIYRQWHMLFTEYLIETDEVRGTDEFYYIIEDVQDGTNREELLGTNTYTKMNDSKCEEVPQQEVEHYLKRFKPNGKKRRTI